GIQVADGIEQRRLEPREGEVEPGNARDGKVVRLRVAVPRQAIDLRAAWIAEAEQPRPLVEGLSGGVVQGRAEDGRLRAAILHVEQQRVPPARQQAEKRRLQRVRLQV